MKIKSFLLFIVSVCYVEAVALKDLCQFGEACNIEAGRPAKTLKENQKWYSLNVILDRPFIDKITLEDITAANKHALKEGTLHDYNEAQANASYLLIASYLIDNARKITDLSADEKVTITIHIHRRTSGIPQINLIVKLLKAYYDDERFEEQTINSPMNDYVKKVILPEQNIEIILRNDSSPKIYGRYEQSQIVLSLGLVMGLNKDYPSGTFIVADTFTPFDEEKNTLYIKDRYTVENHLQSELSDIVEDNERQEKVLRIINSRQDFLSPNPEKADQTAIKMKASDFKTGSLLQIQGLWKPKDHEKEVKVEG